MLPVEQTPWAQAWQHALYGPDGFYRQPVGPAGHFATATQGGPQLGAVLAGALVTLMGEHGLTTVVDVGCGRGELLTAVHQAAPGLRCVGVDVVDRPDLPPGVGWVRAGGGAALPPGLSDLEDTLLLAHEWLDVVPCTVAQVDHDGALREVLVDPATGRERLGGPLSAADALWCRALVAGRRRVARRPGGGRPQPRRGVGATSCPGSGRVWPSRSTTATSGGPARPAAP